MAQSIAVHTVFQSDGALRLTYHITARPAQLSIPAPCPPSFTDGLWQHTCLEVFVATPGEEAYREFNFSPSGQWAAYAFHAYRQRNPDFSPALAPQISISHRTDGLTLEALLPAALLPQAEGSAELQLGLSAIIEDNSGDLSYWALAHPAERPDFHHHSCFCLKLSRKSPGRPETFLAPTGGGLGPQDQAGGTLSFPGNPS